MWVEGKHPKREFIDWNAKYRAELKGELREDEARKTLGRFLTYNVGMLTKFLTGFNLYPDQRIIIKGWLSKNNSMTVAGRGYAKSWTASHFCYLFCLLNPGKTVIMIAPTFRSSRKIVENIERWASSEKRGKMLKACIKTTRQGDIASKKPDLYEIKFKNGSSIIALPLGGDPEKIRGYRCSALVVDEGLMISQTTIDTVLKPFLIAVSEEDIIKRQVVTEKETALIRNGRMKEEERTKWGSDAKMVILSSASYSWQDLFTLYKKYLGIIYKEDDVMMAKLTEEEKKKLLSSEDYIAEVDKEADVASTYLVHQLSYKAAPPERIDSSIRKEIESGMYSESTIRREYEAQFVQDSDGYFRAKSMEECTLSGPNAPCSEIVGEKGFEYILAIDPNMAGSETADHFAMCVIKIVEKESKEGVKTKVGLVVHQYANAGAKLEHHIAYLYYILNRFNIVYVAVDTSQGDNMDFIGVANESELFRGNKLELKSLDVDFGKETFDHLATEIQKSYNKQDKRIVQKQYFHSAFQRAANEHLQASFSRRTILFPAKILENQTVVEKLHHQDVGPIINSHPDFKLKVKNDGGADTSAVEMGSKEDFIERQDVLVDLVKKECALIEVKVSSLGNVSYDLPSHVKKQSKSKARNRRDSYSALFLGNWALKLYLEAQTKPTEESEFFASWAVTR